MGLSMQLSSHKEIGSTSVVCAGWCGTAEKVAEMKNVGYGEVLFL